MDEKAESKDTTPEGTPEPPRLTEQQVADLMDRDQQLQQSMVDGIARGLELLGEAVQDHGPKSPQYVIARQMFRSVTNGMRAVCTNLGIELPEATMEVAELARRAKDRRDKEQGTFPAGAPATPTT